MSKTAKASLVADEPLRPVQMFKAMKQKVFRLLEAEAKMNVAERRAQQWQLLFQIDGHGQYIVGKGGVNTMFYKVGDAERELCLPADLLDKIDTWVALAGQITYCIMRDGKVIKRNLSESEAKTYKKAQVGDYLCSISDGKRRRLMKMSKGLMGKSAWKPYEKKATK